MTTEVVVMNRQAVALAADSAVTIGDGPKIFNTENKVFMLASKFPVGILVYQSMTFMGIPWEIIIKTFRDEVAKSDEKKLLEDYSIEFLKYLEKNGNAYIPDEYQENFFGSCVFREFNKIVFYIWDNIKDVFYKNAQISDKEISEIVSQHINWNFEKWEKFENIFLEKKNEIFRKELELRFKS